MGKNSIGKLRERATMSSLEQRRIKQLLSFHFSIYKRNLKRHYENSLLALPGLEL